MTYEITWCVNPEVATESREELIASLQEELDEELEYDRYVRWNATDPTPYIPLATLGVATISMLIEIIQFIKSQDGSEIAGMNSGDGDRIVLIECKRNEVENFEGTYIENVEGDLHLVKMADTEYEEE